MLFHFQKARKLKSPSSSFKNAFRNVTPFLNIEHMEEKLLDLRVFFLRSILQENSYRIKNDGVVETFLLQ
jgi:hypothetical protein